MCVEWHVMIAFPVLFYQIVLIATAFHSFGEREGSNCCQMEDVLHSSHLRDGVDMVTLHYVFVWESGGSVCFWSVNCGSEGVPHFMRGWGCLRHRVEYGLAGVDVWYGVGQCIDCDYRIMHVCALRV